LHLEGFNGEPIFPITIPAAGELPWTGRKLDWRKKKKN
jgi:hypothetical protein